jgi:hypothetical protein
MLAFISLRTKNGSSCFGLSLMLPDAFTLASRIGQFATTPHAPATTSALLAMYVTSAPT